MSPEKTDHLLPSHVSETNPFHRFNGVSDECRGKGLHAEGRQEGPRECLINMSLDKTTERQQKERGTVPHTFDVLYPL